MVNNLDLCVYSHDSFLSVIRYFVIIYFVFFVSLVLNSVDIKQYPINSGNKTLEMNFELDSVQKERSEFTEINAPNENSIWI